VQHSSPVVPFLRAANGTLERGRVESHPAVRGLSGEWCGPSPNAAPSGCSADTLHGPAGDWPVARLAPAPAGRSPLPQSISFHLNQSLIKVHHLSSSTSFPSPNPVVHRRTDKSTRQPLVLVYFLLTALHLSPL
jgi:hypothetical protein